MTKQTNIATKQKSADCLARWTSGQVPLLGGDYSYPVVPNLEKVELEK